MSAAVQFIGLDAVNLPPRPVHLAIGMFDGVHLGHRSVIEAAVQSARRTGGVAGVLTFDPHPSALLRPDKPTRLIHDTAVKVRLLESLGVDCVITQPFTREFASVSAEELIPLIKRSVPGLQGIYVGENWRFGQGRRGDVAFLVAEGQKHAVSVFSAPRVNMDGEPVSSTRIRALLETGRMASANALLGYAYFAEGKVTSGRKLGRTLGFPTLNLSWDQALRPMLGVYRVRVSGPGAAGILCGVANYGLRPTVEDASVIIPRFEVHILGTCPFGTGDMIRVEWLEFMRPEKRFAGLEELKAQIAQDVLQARREFSLP